MMRLTKTLCVLAILMLAACGDDAVTGGGDTGNGDGGPSDAAGDTTGDGDGDGGGDSGGEDGGGVDGGDDLSADGGSLFPSCVPAAEETCNNGLDDNCDGRVDEACSCAGEGTMQSCYLGAASDLEAQNARCEAGSQTCTLEFWTACDDAVGPIDEVCDNGVDDDCNGTVDDGCEELAPTAICPPDFEDDVLNTYRLVGDWDEPSGLELIRLFWRQISAPPGHSRDFTEGLPPEEIEFFADVAGTYEFEFFVESPNGSDTCTTTFVARTADSLRIEMFWNADYEEAEGLPRDRSDFDLYLLRDPPPGGEGDWYYRDNPDNPGLPIRGEPNENSCHWRNCNTCPRSPEDDPEFADHPCQMLSDSERVRECLCRDILSNPPPEITPEDVWPEPVLDWPVTDDPLDDPRLDLDDTEGKGPENINIRLPVAGTYRVAVHFFDHDGFGDVDGDGFRHANAQVRILCAGAVTFASEAVDMRIPNGIPFAWWQGEFWEVGDLEVSYVNENIVCNFTPFGTEGCRRICTLEESDDGCEGAEINACD